MLTRFFRIALLGIAVLTVGCASVTGGSNQQMYIQVNNVAGLPVDKADCELSNDKGKWTVHAPDATTIARSNKAMLVKCQSVLSSPGSISVESTTRAAMFGNILIGGVIGAGIDHISGAAYEYPGIVTVTMGRASTAKTMNTPATSPGGATAISRVMFEPSGFASLEDVDRIPGPESTRAVYRRFLARPLPRAMAISDNGHAWFANGWHGRDPTKPADPNQRAIEACRDSGGTNCRLYAVDKDVVYVRDTSAAQDAAALAQSAPPAVPAVAKKSRYELPPESGFADVNDASSIPLGDEGRGKYLQFLTLPAPRAFAISMDGAWTVASNSASAMADVLNACERQGKTCWLYAADDRVVWKMDLKQRIGRVHQLVPAATQ